MKKINQLRDSAMGQFVLYLIVGGLATIVEWVGFYLLNGKVNMHYMIATTLAFILSTFANWLFGRILLFKGTGNLTSELAKIYVTAIVGLLLNLILMWVMINKLKLIAMVAKIIATAIVFFWNFFVRKFAIYKM